MLLTTKWQLTWTQTPTPSLYISVQQPRGHCHIWNEKTKTVYLIELTVCFDENFADVSMRKQAKYHDLREAVEAAGHKCHLWTVQVGSRGIIDEVIFPMQHPPSTIKHLLDVTCCTKVHLIL